MAGRIPQSFINDLIGRVDIVDVVGARVQLKKAGANHKGLCPFHNEKTPSFNVHQDKQFYHCFGCEANGTAISFLMEYDNLPFPEAVEALAAIAGVEVPREQGDREPKPDTGLYEVLEAAATRFRGWLRSEPEEAGAVNYLKERGVSGEIARDFGIGLAPSGWDRLKAALESFGSQKLIAAGLLVQNESGRTYDRFRERIVFPIRDTRGRVIGFGGRVFADGEPKYINSPETEVFHKGRELYGLFEARRAQRRLDSVLVVEGYMDVVALAQHGFANAVATLGTAIGQAHFETLYRHVNLVVCCFDGDEAGRGAAWKAVDAAFPVLSETRQLKFVFLPEGEDPDTVVRARGHDHFQRLVQGAVGVGEYFLEHVQAGLDLAEADGRALLYDLALPHIRRLPRGALRQVLTDGLAARSRIDAASIERALGGSGGSPFANRERAADYGGGRHGPLSRRGERLLHLVVKYPELIDGLDQKDRSALADSGDSSLLADVVRYLMEQSGTDTGTLLARYVGQGTYGELAALVDKPLELASPALKVEFETGVRRYLADRYRLPFSRDARERGSLDDLQRLADAKREHERLL